mmetsp:Transcript_28206/g.42699  ORF Transcript_28206/g.42699 Transcript_28206/m.42699 type:complete len:85 (-) Transcript_28206:380-634(-)
MPQYGKNLLNYFIESSLKFSTMDTLCIGLQIFDQLQCVHMAGYVFNDLKPDNILIDLRPDQQPATSIFASTPLHLIDFGFCTRW